MSLLIFQKSTSVGIGTWSGLLSRPLWLPGFRRAGPSTPLDENHPIVLLEDGNISHFLVKAAGGLPAGRFGD
jgi:hypothetical protein